MMFELATNTDITARALLAREERRGREETRAVDVPAARFDETLFLSYHSDVPSMHLNEPPTPTGDELKQSMTVPVREFGRMTLQHDSADRVREARVVLLARKYEGLSTVEDDARLAILTARLQKLSPRVTSADFDNLATMVTEIEQVSSNLDEIRSKFGLK
jgi:hypothetical protein